MVAYFRPATLEEALALRRSRDLAILAGGTDLFPTRTTREAWGETAHRDVLDISGISGLRGISAGEKYWRIGCLATWTDIVRADLPRAFDGLKLAAREVGGVQIQNRGTVVGNICNASPAADGTPCLLCLDAEVEIASADGLRTLPLQAFFDGYRSTVCRADEIVTAILIPRLPDSALSGFLKLGARRYLVISIVMVAGVVVADERGRIAAARIAVGACSPVARRMTALEEALEGLPLDGNLADAVEDVHFDVIAPIDDVRASAGYRAHAARDLVRDLLAGFRPAAGERAA